MAGRYLAWALLYALPFSAALDPAVLNERCDVEAYSYTKMGHGCVKDLKTYYTTSTRPCTTTKTVHKTDIMYQDVESTFTTTTTCTKTVTAKTAFTPTIPASKGFIPIADSIPGASFDPAANIEKREAAPTSRTRSLLARNDHAKHDAAKKHKYGTPQSVDVVYYMQQSQCSEEIFTQTHMKNACKSKMPTTVTKTTTATTTEYPSTAAPFFEACGPRNLANSYRKQPLDFYTIDNGISVLNNPEGYTAEFLNATEAYDCCVAAIQRSPPAALWGFEPAVGDNCIVVSLTGCSAPRRNPSTEAGDFNAEIGSSAGSSFVPIVGNAYCGQWFRGCLFTDDGTEDGVEVCIPPRTLPAVSE